MFLGSSEEMYAFYKSKGYAYDVRAHEVNGTEFHIFKHPDPKIPSVMVIHGLDSEARMMQIGALMTVNGKADARRCVIRGNMDRVREYNRQVLRKALLDVRELPRPKRGTSLELKPIAGAVIGNKNEAIQAIAERFGVKASDLKEVPWPAAGPYKAPGDRSDACGKQGANGLWLSRRPMASYACLEFVLMQLGCRCFATMGAGGSLNAGDKIGDTHQADEALSGNA
ncbi:MAG: hypothetical protein R3C68_16445 [Myxococcota bacterium]